MSKHPKTLRSYADFALSVVAGMSFLFGVVFTQELPAPDASVIDWKIAIGCFVLMGLCVAAARSRVNVLASAIAVPSAFLFLKFSTSGDMGALWRGIVFFALSLVVAVVAGVIVYFRDR
jgi:hypothetical protein